MEEVHGEGFKNVLNVEDEWNGPHDRLQSSMSAGD